MAFFEPKKEVVSVGRLRSCAYCGRIHPSDFDCGRRPVYNRFTKQTAFRSGKPWQRKRREIRRRDYNLCRLCLNRGMLVYDDLSVHHIAPLHLCWDRRLDDANLITLCATCHRQAEEGQVEETLLFRLASTPPGEGEVFF